MTMTDPIADMLTRIRNANVAMHDSVRMPSSKLKESLAEILEREGYISGFATSVDEARPGGTLEIQLKYTNDRLRAIAGLKRVSKPGLRIYARADKLPRVLGGLGVAVLSTSKGLMTDRDARRQKIGGEVLCYVW
jgi:small subunit ribosomal protein S8